MYGIRSAATIFTYMLQNVEYAPGPYVRWFWRTQDFSKVMYRRQLDLTKAARLIRLALIAGMTFQLVMGLLLLALWHWHGWMPGKYFGPILLVSYPLVWAHVVVAPLILGRELKVKPQQKKHITASKQIFEKHSAVKIAIAGSYGKTSMKELLLTVFGEGKKVAATPANKNVAISHAHFARKLEGDEAILLIEYGEGEPGDVRRFSETTQPTHGIITGLAPAHLDKYKTLQAAGEDIFSLADYLHGQNVYINAESLALQPFLKEQYQTYSAADTLGWKVSNVDIRLQGTGFTLSKGKQKLAVHSQLLGRHHIGPLSLAVALGLELGLSEAQVKAGVAKTAPYEHRMFPYKLGGAWIIDDTYNGNIEGIRAGTALLAELPAKRKMYVTPGLVDQGNEAESVHVEMGKLIAAAKPDKVVLMQNSATKHIQAGLESAGYQGEVQVETQPLDFYQNLEQYVAAGDLVLMQNDWTDNYA